MQKEKSKDIKESENIYKIDIKTSWNYYKSNSNAFLSIQIIVLVPIFISILVLAYLDTDVQLTLTYNYWKSAQYWSMNTFVYRIIEHLSLFIIGGTYGLSYDILTRGDEFAESKGFFYYIKKNWKKYLIITFFMMLLVMFENLLCIEVNTYMIDNDIFGSIQNHYMVFLVCSIIDGFFEFLCLLLFVGWITSVTSQESIFNGFIQNFIVLKRRFREVFKTTIFIFAVFILPFSISTLICKYYFYTGSWFVWIPQFIGIGIQLNQYIFYYLIGIPLLAIFRTQIYNSVDFTKDEIDYTTSIEESIKENDENDNKDNFGYFNNLTLGWIYYKNNFWAFFGVQIIAFLPMIGISIIIYWIDASGIYLFGDSGIDSILYIFRAITAVLLGSTYGLAYDILSSGNEFAEFKGCVAYFKKHWWKYILVMILMLLLNGIIRNKVYDIVYYFMWDRMFTVNSDVYSILIEFRIVTSSVIVFFNFLWFVLFFGLLASITSQGNVIRGFKENFQLLISRFKEVLKSAITLFLIFSFVFTIISWILYSLSTYRVISTDLANFLYKFFQIMEDITYYLVLIPMTAIVSTSIYNSKFPPKGIDRNEK